MSKVNRLIWREERKVTHDYQSRTVAFEMGIELEEGDDFAEEFETLKKDVQAQVDLAEKQALKALVSKSKS